MSQPCTMIGRDEMLNGSNSEELETIQEKQYRVPGKKDSASVLEPGCTLHHLQDLNADPMSLTKSLDGKSLESSAGGSNVHPGVRPTRFEWAQEAIHLALNPCSTSYIHSLLVV